MIIERPFRRALSAAVAACVALAPSLPAYAGSVEIVRLQPVSAPQGARAIAVPAAGAIAPSLSMPSLSVLSPSIGAGVSAAPTPTAAPSPAAASAAALPAPAAAPAAPAAAAAQALAVAAPAPALAGGVAAPAAASRRAAPVQAISREVSAALESAGDLTAAAPAGLRGLGQRLEAALTGAPALSGNGAILPAASSRMDDLSDRRLARPAGESIRQAAEANAALPSPEPAASAAPAPVRAKGPFWPKLLASGLALAPVALLAVPLLTSGSLVLGGLTAAGGLALATMPFLGESAAKPLRALPGGILAALGVAAVLSGFTAPGVFAAVGGWGLTRYGLGLSRVPRYDSIESLSAYFGGVAALTGVALAAATPAGWLAAAAAWTAYPVSALLWLHLPSWVGEGVGAAFSGAWLSVKGLSRVMTAVHRDTNLLERLESFSERQWRASKWNGVWLAVMWTPILAVELLKRALAAVAGLYVGALQVPAMFGWGASYKLFGPGKAAAYFAEAARFVFDRVQNGKVSIFNPIEAKVLPLANSENFAARAAGSLALTALQLGWIVYAAAATPALTVGGLLLAFGRMGTFDETRHSPSSLKVGTSDSPGAKPTEPTQPTEPTEPVQAPLAPKLIASALALIPALYFGVPLIAGTLFHAVGLLYAALALPLAAMPFMGPRTPRILKSLAAQGLFLNGFLLLASGHAVILGLLATLGGWGFERYVKERDGKDGRFDDASELGAFFGALGASVGIGAAWIGLAGPWGWAALGLAALTSPFLLIHLPSWVGEGVYGALEGLPQSMRDYARALSFWREDTKFLSNLRRQASYWLDKTYWHGVWLSTIWVPVGLISAAEYLLSIALGAVSGVARAPLAFAASAVHKARPNGRADAFLRAALDGWRASAEGSKPVLDKLVSPFKAAIDEASPVTGRPTLKAAAALLAARVVQLGWLIGELAMFVSGASLAVGLYRGARAAFGAKPAEKN